MPSDYGLHWFKGQSLGSGQCPVERYNRRLRDLIAADNATPSSIVSHDLSLEQGDLSTRQVATSERKGQE